MAVETKKVKVKKVGYLDIKIIREYNLYQYKNKNIVQSTNLNKHTLKHANEFKSVDSYNETLLKIREVFKSPYYVYFDENKNSLKYYKKLEEYVCVVVNLTEKDVFVSTFYPVNKIKIDKLKKQSKHKTPKIDNKL